MTVPACGRGWPDSCRARAARWRAAQGSAESATAVPRPVLLDLAAVRLGGDSMSFAERLFVGDEVELTVNVPGHRQLQAGLRGRVVISGDDAPVNLVSVRAQGRL